MGSNAVRNRLAQSDTRGGEGRPRQAAPGGGSGRGRPGRLSGWPGDGWRRQTRPWAEWLNVPDSYWRRRFFVLVGGLIVLGLVTWGLSDLAGAPRPIPATRPAVRASLSAGDTLPPQAYGAPVSPSPATVTATPSPEMSASPSGPAAMPSAAGSPSAGAGSCAAASMVVSLFTSMPAYGPDQQPRFEVYAVSTAPGNCTMAYGVSLVHVVVTQAGQVIWDSAVCQAPAAAATTVDFAQGVPQLVTVTWDRKASSPACAGSMPAGTKGTFEVVAMADGQSSQVKSFTLV